MDEMSGPSPELLALAKSLDEIECQVLLEPACAVYNDVD